MKMQIIIESTKANQAVKAKAAAAAKAAPFYAAYRHSASALFWSVFGPAARYSFQNPAYQYYAVKKRN